jgi:hypothetical protein
MTMTEHYPMRMSNIKLAILYNHHDRVERHTKWIKEEILSNLIWIHLNYNDQGILFLVFVLFNQQWKVKNALTTDMTNGWFE